MCRQALKHTWKVALTVCHKLSRRAKRTSASNMFFFCVVTVITFTCICPLGTTIVEIEYEQLNSMYNPWCTKPTAHGPASLLSCAKLCTASLTCKAFATGPGKECVLFDPCSDCTLCSQTDVNNPDWKLYRAKGKSLAIFLVLHYDFLNHYSLSRCKILS